MKARLRTERRILEVLTINYSNGEVDSVVTNEDGVIRTIYNTTSIMALAGNVLTVDMKEALEFPDSNEKLVKHLEEILEEENEKLINMAIDAMEDKSDVPFGELPLIAAQKEYKLMQQRVFGIIDTIEDVKAFQEGFFDKNQHIEGRVE